MALDATVGSDAEVSNEALLVMFANGDRDAARLLTVRLVPIVLSHAARLLGDQARRGCHPRRAHAAVENCAGLASGRSQSHNMALSRDRQLPTGCVNAAVQRWMRCQNPKMGARQSRPKCRLRREMKRCVRH